METILSEKVDYLTVKEASQILGVNPETLRRWDNSGKLKTKRHPMNNYRIYNIESGYANNKLLRLGSTCVTFKIQVLESKQAEYQ